MRIVVLEIQADLFAEISRYKILRFAATNDFSKLHGHVLN